MADMNMMVAMLRGAFAALTDEQKREVLGDEYAPQPDLASRLMGVTLEQVLEHSGSVEDLHLIEHLEAEGYWCHNAIDDMVEVLQDEGKQVFEDWDKQGVIEWATSTHDMLVFEDEDELQAHVQEGGVHLAFKDRIDAINWCLDNADDYQGPTLYELARKKGMTRVFEDDDAVVEYVRGLAADPSRKWHRVFADDDAVFEYVRKHLKDKYVVCRKSRLEGVIMGYATGLLDIIEDLNEDRGSLT